MSAFLNIAFVLIGQTAIPSVWNFILPLYTWNLRHHQFIAEMENPKDFPKGM